jgi:hypothetical protein
MTEWAPAAAWRSGWDLAISPARCHEHRGGVVHRPGRGKDWPCPASGAPRPRSAYVALAALIVTSILSIPGVAWLQTG